jgi:hypothetical protein
VFLFQQYPNMVVILSTECSQKLTNSPFGHSGTKIT